MKRVQIWTLFRHGAPVREGGLSKVRTGERTPQCRKAGPARIGSGLGVPAPEQPCSGTSSTVAPSADNPVGQRKAPPMRHGGSARTGPVLVPDGATPLPARHLKRADGPFVRL